MREISAERLPQNVLIKIFLYLNLNELGVVMCVCSRWKRVCETADYELWSHHAHKILPGCAQTDPYLFANLPLHKDRIRAFKHAWNPSDASRNVFVRANCFTVHRQPVAQSTDGIRGKIGVNKGAHCWEFCWEGPLGTCAVIGVATRHAAVHCPGYIALIGSDDQSWGWNLVDNTIMHNGQSYGKYPRLFNNTPKYQIGERIRMILDHNKGQLYYEKADEFYGMAFAEIPPVRLFPAVCTVYGNTEISMTYLGPPSVG